MDNFFSLQIKNADGKGLKSYRRSFTSAQRN